MKIKLLLGAALITSMTTFTAPVQAADIAQTLCDYTAADDKKRMRSFLKTNKLKVRSVFKSIQCNRKNLLVFADSVNSVKIGEYIISKLPKKFVTSTKDQLTNSALISKAADRTGS
jgi:hypothetical protein